MTDGGPPEGEAFWSLEVRQSPRSLEVDCEYSDRKALERALTGRARLADLLELPTFTWIKGGQRLTDYVTSWDAPHLVSDAFLQVISDNGLTGAYGVPVRVLGKNREPLTGYHLLVITATVRRRRWTPADVVPNGSSGFGVTVQGLPFDLTTWDGQDFFCIYGEYGQYVSRRAHDALSKAHLFNLDLDPAWGERRSFVEKEWAAHLRESWRSYRDGIWIEC